MKLIGFNIDLKGRLSDFCVDHESHIVEMISHPEHFGDFAIRFNIKGTDLRIVRDRGQVFVEAKHGDEKPWRGLDEYLTDPKNQNHDAKDVLEALRNNKNGF
jgi:hypothetical protein